MQRSMAHCRKMWYTPVSLPPVRKEEDTMRLIGNVLWFVFAGLWLWLGWTLAGLLWCVTIVGIPWGL